VTISATAGGDLRSYQGERRPVIGISASFQQARWGNWDAQATLLPRRYADRVSEAGGVPVLLPPAAGITEALRRLDGLVLSGGGDIDPARYGAAAAAQTGPLMPERDAAELAVYHQARAAGLPLLGICRGLQVINVAAGGTLHQHLPDVVGHGGHSPAEGSYGTHEVTVAPGSRLAGVLGKSAGPGLAVPTHHHQAIDRLGGGLTATAWTADGIIEAIEPEPGDSAFLLAVQWHPEAGDDLSLFRALTLAAAAAMAGA
jgi:putative glutamine amidotransferase